MRVADAKGASVIADSVILYCCKCISEIFVSPSSVDLIAKRGNIELLCAQCASKLIEDDPDPQFVPLTKEQRGEIATHFGIRLKGRKP